MNDIEIKICVEVEKVILHKYVVLNKYRRDGVVVRTSSLMLVDLGFILLVVSYQKPLKMVP